ncbi:hypothetical protein [Rhizobium sp. 18065]|uniref:hypothetical protein n=1 Tax=Rhizobium sp. 18065 TaxID=2681411 RepID=UPI00135A18B2|nr:hypothetical protein [Rhizobium sp. 18065]
MHQPLPKRAIPTANNVSFHAVTRFVQRILGVTVEGDFVSNKVQAQHHCDAAGLTIEKVRLMIWTPAVEMAARSGFPSVGTSMFRATFNGDGVVVTIREPSRKEHRKLKLMSDTEMKARAHRKYRRVRKMQKQPNRSNHND